jgi:DNA-binding NarL/FixJ family response regulator
MSTVVEVSERCESIALDYESPRLSVIVADGTPRYPETVCDVLDLHEIVDLVGRAANFEETIQLAVNLRPDLVLIDVEMPSTMVAIAAMITAGADIQIVGMFEGTIPLVAAGLILSVNAFVDKSRLRTKLVPLLQTMRRYRAVLNPPRPSWINPQVAALVPKPPR